MTETFAIDVRARLVILRDKWGIYGDTNDVVTWRHRILTIAAVQHEELSGKRKAIRVSPACRDSLIARNADRAAVPKFSWARCNTTDRYRVRICIQHAETTLGSAPNATVTWIDKFVKSVVPKVEVMVTTSKLKQTIIGSKVHVWVTHEDVSIARIGRHYCETHEPA